MAYRRDKQMKTGNSRAVRRLAKKALREEFGPDFDCLEWVDDDLSLQFAQVDAILHLKSGAWLLVEVKCQTRDWSGQYFERRHVHYPGTRAQYTSAGWINRADLSTDLFLWVVEPCSTVYLYEWDELRRVWVSNRKVWRDEAKANRDAGLHPHEVPPGECRWVDTFNEEHGKKTQGVAVPWCLVEPALGRKRPEFRYEYRQGGEPRHR